MDIFTWIILAFALSMDCFAVSICISGISKTKFKDDIKIPLIFASIQAALLVAGYYLGSVFESLIKAIDHWIAFVLLAAIGAKLIIESTRKTECKNLNTNSKLVIFALATSIDALVVGIALSLVNGPIWIGALVVGIVTALVTLSGLLIGKKIHNMQINYAGIIGGVFLILLGLKILIEHLFF